MKNNILKNILVCIFALLVNKSFADITVNMAMTTYNTGIDDSVVPFRPFLKHTIPNANNPHIATQVYRDIPGSLVTDNEYWLRQYQLGGHDIHHVVIRDCQRHSQDEFDAITVQGLLEHIKACTIEQEYIIEEQE